ncbi:hypothetical protein HKX48_001072, partial [Thoreauomyces humboldtii]
MSERFLYMAPGHNVTDLQGYLDILGMISQESRTTIFYEPVKNAIKITGEKQAAVDAAYDAVQGAIRITASTPEPEPDTTSSTTIRAVQPGRAIPKPDHVGDWGDRHDGVDMRSKLPDSESDEDLEPATLPTLRALHLAAIDEYASLRADLPVLGALNSQILPREPYAADPTFYKDHVMSTRKSVRSSVFRLHAITTCRSYEEHDRTVERAWMFEPTVLDHLTPREEHEMIFCLRRVLAWQISQNVKTCLAYSRSSYLIRIIASSENAAAETLNRLNALQAYLREIIHLPIPIKTPRVPITVATETDGETPDMGDTNVNGESTRRAFDHVFKRSPTLHGEDYIP